jgi:hypothetical protein
VGLLRVEELALRLSPGAGFINGLDPLERHGEASRVNLAAVAELVVLTFPDEFSPQDRKGMWVSRSVLRYRYTGDGLFLRRRGDVAPPQCVALQELRSCARDARGAAVDG